MTPATERRIALVLGGGGLKGFAHVGVLRALEERGVTPYLFAGTSIGALIAAAHAAGMTWHEMSRRAQALRRRDLFRINHVGMLFERMRSPALYLEEPLRFLCESVAPTGRFSDLSTRLLVNTVDIVTGSQVVWGTPGFQDVSVADAVYASCALPGFYPPGVVGGRTCVDGGVIDNLPASIAAIGMDAVIAVDVGNSDLSHHDDIVQQGFANIYMRAATVMMHALQQVPLTNWNGPPMILIRPKVAHLDWFNFTHTMEIIHEGYRAAAEALQHLDVHLSAPSGVYPRRRVRVTVDRELCTGCGLCVALEPAVMALDAEHKAYATEREFDWSPANGAFIYQCPTGAIRKERLSGATAPVPDPA